ncbi:arabinose efflux permease family protein [Pseudomonas sp. GM78]|uniref:MFS transporter n=1 Tax=Pseudomonas sp. GM78 TaxID=1144337 RepID=UPI00026F5A23|nr:MFS transporter [Pseudomonas sp. GM78]EJN32660.1 arabinose efflux permease family protein [Pseudomonas sp. GM78]
MNDGSAVAAVAQRTPSVKGALASLSLAMLLSSLGTSIANVGLPSLTQAFSASFQQVQWVVIAYLLAITTLIVSVGRLGDLVGRRRLLLWGIALFTLASALCGLAPNLGLLIAARALQGLGAAVMMTLTIAFVGETVAKGKTGGAMGLLGTMSAIGTAMGPALGGVLIGGFGWRSMFLVCVPLGLSTWLLAQRYLPEDRPATTGRTSFDSLGTLFRDTRLSGSLAMSLLVTSVMMATLLVGPFYLSQTLGLTAVQIGLVLSVGPLVAALTGVPAGRIVDRCGAPGMTLAGLVGMTFGCLMLSVVPETFGVGGYLAPMVVVTLGYAVFQTANNTAVMLDVPADQRGVVSGLLNLSRNLGLVTGASALGAVFALASKSVDIGTAHPQAIASGLRTTFVVALGLIVVACLIAWRRQADAR